MTALQAVWMTGVGLLILAMLPWRQRIIADRLIIAGFTLLAFIASMHIMGWLWGR